MAKCADPACISRTGDKLDADARLLVIPCEHWLCARCARRRVQDGKGSGTCAVASCRAAFRHDEAQDASKADAVAMKREAQARRRVTRAFPKDLADFVTEHGGDELAAGAALSEYRERAEWLVARLLDRTPLPDGKSTVAEVAAAELRALESDSGRHDRVASARRERDSGRAAADLAAAEREAEEAEAAEAEADRSRRDRLRRKRVRETTAAVDGGRPDDGDEDGDGAGRAAPRRPPPLRSRATAGALAGVNAATASGARMRRPALPHVPPPRALDRGSAPGMFHDGRSAGDEATVAVRCVEERAGLRAAAAGTSSLLLGPQQWPGGPCSALGAAAVRRSKRFAALRRV